MARLRFLVLLVALAAVVVSWPSVGRSEADAPRPKAVVLITIDTLRADWVSFAGYSRPTTPFLDRLAEDGVVFHRAYATSSWTSPSMASLMTGLYPTSHGVTSGTVSRETGVMNQPVLSDRFATLAELFSAAGYKTFGVPTNRHLSADLGFAQGFDHYLRRADFAPAPRVLKVTHQFLLREFGRNWRVAWKQHPSFLWLHFFDPHAPYEAREPWAEQFSPEFGENPGDFPAGLNWPQIQARFPKPGERALTELRPLYESEIAYVDRHIERLSGFLHLDDPDLLLVVTSDHGEEFADHGGLGHGHTLYEELVRIPLLVRWPAGIESGLEVDDVVGLHDIYPTLLELAGITVPDNIPAESFADLLRGGTREQQRPAFFELYSRGGGRSGTIGMSDESWKIVRRRGAGSRAEVYNLAEDPGELNDLAGADRDRTRRFEVALRDWMKGLQPPGEVEQLSVEDEELRKQLEALGYIGGGR